MEKADGIWKRALKGRGLQRPRPASASPPQRPRRSRQLTHLRLDRVTHSGRGGTAAKPLAAKPLSSPPAGGPWVSFGEQSRVNCRERRGLAHSNGHHITSLAAHRDSKRNGVPNGGTSWHDCINLIEASETRRKTAENYLGLGIAHRD